ncbi:zinc-dependent alcohol dehydrogenase family protein [Catenulispora sp. GAS73]|uniref:zinc-dependent alcohol dehydrogenase family protein n=1 Tax=Catenulispora sp. GAS73 TaxID=3156269 RepID=UPI003511B547
MSEIILSAVGGDLAQTVALAHNPDPVPGAGDVLVEVEAAPINPSDVLFAAGWFAVQPRVPSGLGGEGVGRVVQAGPGVDAALVGRRVLLLPTFQYGTWAERIVVPAEYVVPVPDDADPPQLAMLPINSATAYLLLRDFAAFQPGDWIGMNLANSAVGQNLIPLAKHAGLKVLAVVRRQEVAEQVEQLGADLVLIDGDGLGDRALEALGQARLRVLFEGTGDSAQVAELVRTVESGGSVVVFTSITGQAPTLPLPDLMFRGVSLRAFLVLNWVRDASREEREQVYSELFDLLKQGVFSVAVEATYSLEQFQDALAHAQRPGRSGKVLFTPGLRSGR